MLHPRKIFYSLFIYLFFSFITVLCLVSAPNSIAASSVLMYPYGSSIGDVPLVPSDCDNGYVTVPVSATRPEFRFFNSIKEQIYVSNVEYILFHCNLSAFDDVVWPFPVETDHWIMQRPQFRPTIAKLSAESITAIGNNWKKTFEMISSVKLRSRNWTAMSLPVSCVPGNQSSLYAITTRWKMVNNFQPVTENKWASVQLHNIPQAFNRLVKAFTVCDAIWDWQSHDYFLR